MSDFFKTIQGEIKELKDKYLSCDKRFENENFAFNYWVAINCSCLSDDFFEFCENNLLTFTNGEYGYIIDSSNDDTDDRDIIIVHTIYIDKNGGLKISNFNKFLDHSIFSNDGYKNEKIINTLNAHKNINEYVIYEHYYCYQYENNVSKNVKERFSDYKSNTTFSYNTIPKLIYLDEIERKYFDKPEIEQDFQHIINVKTKQHTISLFGNESDEDKVHTTLCAVGTMEIYNMLIKSEESDYNLFDDNIREYLGTIGKLGKINKNIQATLDDDNDRNKFFYYNNGVTLMCKFHHYDGRQKIITVTNPKVVNGCQTVNTIKGVIENHLKNNDISEVVKKFKQCFVLVKFYDLDKQNENENIIYKNIVKNTNMQMGITPKDFILGQEYFYDMQKEFKKFGFHLLVRQSDKYTLEKNQNLFNNLSSISCDRYKMIIGEDIIKPKDISIDLKVLLRVLMAFYYDGYTVYRSGQYLLKETSKYYNEFSKKILNFLSVDNMINLYLTFVKCGGLKVGHDRYPVPYHLIDFIGRKIKNDKNGKYSCDIANNKLKFMYGNSESFNQIYNLLSNISESYAKKYMRKMDVDYSKFVKQRMDVDMLDDIFDDKFDESKRYNQNYYLEFMNN